MPGIRGADIGQLTGQKCFLISFHGFLLILLNGSVLIALPRIYNTRGESQTLGLGDSYLSVAAASATLMSR